MKYYIDDTILVRGHTKWLQSLQDNERKFKADMGFLVSELPKEYGAKMAYTTKELEEMCLDAIKEHKLRFFTWLDAYIAPALSTLKDHKLAESAAIKKALNVNRVARLQKIDELTKDSDNPTLIIAEKKVLYKVMGDEDMLDALNGGSKQQESGKVEIEIIDKTIKKVGE